MTNLGWRSHRIWQIGAPIAMFGAMIVPAWAQIVPDSTLRNERSQVNPFNPQIDVIEGGASRGANLFHSFREFNVAAGRSVYFLSPSAGIQNILARVTGNNPSQILGRLGTAGLDGNRLTAANASLFLMNPNGIVFGKDASLDVDRSFFATTADGIQFSDRGTFSASRPEGVVDVLTINPSAFLFNRTTVSDITVRANAPIGVSSSPSELRVPNGETLTLLGGNVNIEGGSLNAFGGRVEIGAVSGTGAIGVNQNGSLSFSENIDRGDVLFRNDANVDVALLDKGNIKITARNIVLERSQLSAGIDALGGKTETQAGDIILNATGELQLRESSLIQNNVNQNGTGNGGNIIIMANSLVSTGGSQISASSFGAGNAGNVTVKVSDRVSISGVTPDGHFVSAILNNVAQGGEGKGGNLVVSANTLELINGGQLTASTRGKGDAGNITINVKDRITLSGVTPDGQFVSAIFNNVAQGGEGQGGNLVISASTLELINGAQLTANTRGKGDAGNITIDVKDRVSISGVTPDGQFVSAILNGVGQEGEGQGGNLVISANTLELINGGQLTANTRGKGDAGNITIDVKDRITLSGTSIFSAVEQGGEGQGGNLAISANTLELIDGGQLTANTRGKGDAGSITIDVKDSITLSGVTPDGQFVSAIFSNVGQEGEGQGGNLAISANTLEINDEGQLAANTSGKGNAGNITIDVKDRITLKTAAIFSNVEQGGEGQGGNLVISANTLELINGAQFAASTEGRGDAGNIFLGRENQAIRSISITGIDTIGQSSGLFTSTINSSLGGNIRIFADQFRLSDGAVVDARTFSSGNSGAIKINARTVELLRGAQILAITDGSGSANTITLNATEQLFISGIDPTYNERFSRLGDTVTPITVSPESGIYTRSRAFENAGQAGSIDITAPRIQLDDRARIDAQSATVNGGNINIQASNRLLLRNRSQISASAGTGGNGGNLNINTGFLIAIPKENSDISANALRGSGGRVTISTSGGILGIESRPKVTELSDITASSGVGFSGTVTLVGPDISNLQNNLTQLPQTAIDTNTLVSNSCIARDQQNGTFYITGRSGFPTNPGELSTYSTGTVQPTNPFSAWKRGEIVEPQGVYRLADGQLVMSRACP